MTIKNRKFGNKSEAHIDEMTFKQSVDDFVSLAPEGGWSDYWSMQQDWEFYKDNLCREGTITSRQAHDVWLNPCTPETFDRWQKRNGLTRRGGYESKKSDGPFPKRVENREDEIWMDKLNTELRKLGCNPQSIIGMYANDHGIVGLDARSGSPKAFAKKLAQMYNESKKSEASKFGAGMSPIKDLSKLRNFGEVLDVLEEHR
jgi:hypothetical protein